MNVLILGSGGREHCFAELISRARVVINYLLRLAILEQA